MRTIFADTFYWTASINFGDDWHDQVIAMTATLGQVKIVTTEEVLSETLTFFSTYGTRMCQRACQLVQGIMSNPKIQVIHQTHESFLTGLNLYQERPDKEYSLIDCISMQTMRELGITEVLIHDRHFTQEGFVILF
jgi:predicted nucleic acid-binding protein